MIWDLHRISFHPLWTLGILFDGFEPIALTCEEPWRWNRSLTSCAPPGSYKVKWHNGTHFKNVFILDDVPERSGILIHNGNTVKDTEGCILVGKSFYKFNDYWGVSDSQDILNVLRDRMKNEVEWVLRINNGGML